jgi:hypothetical protein
LLLTVVDAIALAERREEMTPTPQSRKRHLALAKAATDAARLARQIALLMPPPWSDSQAEIGGLVTQLAGFGSGALSVTAMNDKSVNHEVVKRHLGALLEELSVKDQEALSRLLPSLVHLRMGPSGNRVDRRAIQEYGRSKRKAQSLGAVGEHWSRNWRLVVHVARLAPGRRRDAFAQEIKELLEADSALTPARRRGPRPRKTTDVSRATRLTEARALRDALTRRLQEAKLEGATIYKAEIRSCIDDELRLLTASDRQTLASSISNMIPSAVAVRIAARKHGVPIRDVRARRSPVSLPRNRRPDKLMFSGNIIRMEHALERQRRGLKR